MSPSYEVTTEQDSILNLIYGLKSADAKRQYPCRLKAFLDFLKLEGDLEEQAHDFMTKAKVNPQWIHDNLIRFILFQIERAKQAEIAECTISNYYKPIKLFCVMNGIAQSINWKVVSRGLPLGRDAANDRAPTIDEIRKLVEYLNRRIRPIVYTMCSSGIRIGALDDLKWKHVTPLTNEKGEVVAAKKIVYPGDREQYYTFITSEVYNALKE